MEGVMTNVREQYRVVAFKPIKITQTGPSIDNLGRKYIFVIIYYMNVSYTIVEGPFLTQIFFKLDGECTINVSILSILKQ